MGTLNHSYVQVQTLFAIIIIIANNIIDTSQLGHALTPILNPITSRSRVELCKALYNRIPEYIFTSTVNYVYSVLLSLEQSILYKNTKTIECFTGDTSIFLCDIHRYCISFDTGNGINH